MSCCNWTEKMIEFKPEVKSNVFLENLANSGLFLFIFVLFSKKHRKIVHFHRIGTGIVKVEGEHIDHWATTMTRNKYCSHI